MLTEVNTDADIFGEDTDDEIVELTADNKDDVFGEYEDQYVLSAVGKKPRCSVTVISASFGRVNQFTKAGKGDDDRKTLKALCELIAESVVTRTHDPVWSGAEILRMAKSSTKRFMELQAIVLKHNGLDKQRIEIERLVEDEAKN